MCGDIFCCESNLLKEGKSPEKQTHKTNEIQEGKVCVWGWGGGDMRPL